MFVIETTGRKFKKLNGYKCKGQTRGTVLAHLKYKFSFSEFEIDKGYREGKITIKLVGRSNND